MDYSTLFGLGLVTRTDGFSTSVDYFSLVSMYGVTYEGYSIEDLMCKIIEVHATQIYVHDLNYVSGYILDWLNRNNVAINKNGTRDEAYMSYSMFRDDVGNVYYIKIFFNNGIKRVIEIKSSRNKTMKSLRDLYRDYKLNIELKVDPNSIEDATRQLSYHDKLNQYYKDECYSVAAITAYIMKSLKKAGYNKLTISSDAMRLWNKWEEDENRYHSVDMPNLDEDVEANLRFAYRGGFNWINPKYKGLEVKDGIVYDVNSLYPYIMRYFDLPYGLPDYYYGQLPSGYWVGHFIINGHVKQNGISCLNDMKGLNKHTTSGIINNDFQDDLDQFECWLTNFDYELVVNNYDIDSIAIFEVYGFKTTKGWFDKYIDHFYKVKKGAKGSKREISKLMLDSLYGRFGLKSDKKKSTVSLKDNKLVFENSLNVDNKSIRYLPIALFVTSIGRYLLVNTAMDIGVDKILYMDTDSIHILGYYEDDELLHVSKELGDWKVEESFTRAKYINLKTYIMDVIEDDDVHTVVKMAGAPDSVKQYIDWSNFKQGTTVPGKFYTKIIPGGCIRIECDYTITQI